MTKERAALLRNKFDQLAAQKESEGKIIT
jgi:hypothetical protein